jgi:AraC-like DNA-binding protein
MNFFDKNHTVTEIVAVVDVHGDNGPETVHNNRPSHGIAFFYGKGSIYNFSDGTHIETDTGDVIYLPKGSSYRVKTKTSGAVYCINFDCLGDDSFSPFVIQPLNAEETLKIFQSAERSWNREISERDYSVLSKLYEILYCLKKQKALPYLPKTKKDIIKPAVDYIHKNYAKELIDVKNLSAECGISYDYLRKLFEQRFGVSPIKYINALKINRAKELLSSGLYSVSEVAFSSGFSDLSHFSRFFKANVGVLPSEYY